MKVRPVAAGAMLCLVSAAVCAAGPASAKPPGSPRDQAASQSLRRGTSTERRPLPALQHKSTKAPDLTKWASIRAAFGLEHDAAYLASIQARLDTTNTSLGIPLTAAETANIEARDRLTPSIGSVYAAGIGSDAFGGVDIDQAKGGVLEIKLVAGAPEQDLSKLKAALLAIVPSGVSTEITSVPFSVARMQSEDDAIVADLAKGKLSPYSVLSVGKAGSEVVITVSPDAPSDTEAKLAAAYPEPFVKVERGPGVDFQTGRNHTSGPVYGGEWLSNDQGAQCTSGYAHALNQTGSGRSSEITAGHCGKPGAVWRQGLQFNGGHVGDATSNNGASHGPGTSSKCDCQSVSPVPEAAVTSKTYITFTSLFTYTSLPANTYADFATGKRVCVSGAAFAEDQTSDGGINCGTIVDQNFSDVIHSPYVADGETITNLITVNTPLVNEDGDSGAPVGSGGQFMGIHQGITGSGLEIFSRSTYIASVTGATPVF